jgi:hypothetical protein
MTGDVAAQEAHLGAILGLGLRIEKRLRLDQRLGVAAEPGQKAK